MRSWKFFVAFSLVQRIHAVESFGSQGQEACTAPTQATFEARLGGSIWKLYRVLDYGRSREELYSNQGTFSSQLNLCLDRSGCYEFEVEGSESTHVAFDGLELQPYRTFPQARRRGIQQFFIVGNCDPECAEGETIVELDKYSETAGFSWKLKTSDSSVIDECGRYMLDSCSWGSYQYDFLRRCVPKDDCTRLVVSDPDWDLDRYIENSVSTNIIKESMNVTVDGRQVASLTNVRHSVVEFGDRCRSIARCQNDESPVEVILSPKQSVFQRYNYLPSFAFSISGDSRAQVLLEGASDKSAVRYFHGCMKANTCASFDPNVFGSYNTAVRVAVDGVVHVDTDSVDIQGPVQIGTCRLEDICDGEWEHLVEVNVRSSIPISSDDFVIYRRERGSSYKKMKELGSKVVSGFSAGTPYREFFCVPRGEGLYFDYGFKDTYHSGTSVHYKVLLDGEVKVDKEISGESPSSIVVRLTPRGMLPLSTTLSIAFSLLVLVLAVGEAARHPRTIKRICLGLLCRKNEHDGDTVASLSDDEDDDEASDIEKDSARTQDSPVLHSSTSGSPVAPHGDTGV